MLIQKHSVWIFLALTAFGSVPIVSTCNVFSHTQDEPAHMACGMEYLSKGVYRYEPQHPPLARVAAAIGPYLAGVCSHNEREMWHEGQALLYKGGHYDRNLFLARLGILPFFWIASLVVYVWAIVLLRRAGCCILGFVIHVFAASARARGTRHYGYGVDGNGGAPRF